MDHPYVNVTHAHDSLRCETVQQSLTALRALLLQPLTVVGFADKHRRVSPKPNPSKTTQIIYKYLPTYPDIMVVRAGNGALLHFAPAMLVHLPETQAFSAGGLSGDQMRQAAQKCPHPQLASLSISSSYYLTSLYCPIVSRLVEPQNVLRNTQLTTTGPGMLSLSAVGSLGGAQARANEKIAPQSTHASKSGTKAPFNSDVLPPSPLYMMPFAADCMGELFQRYLMPAPGAAQSQGINIDHLLAHGGDGAAVPEVIKDTSPANSLGALGVLPDHARYRVNNAHFKSSNVSNIGEFRKLRCSYVLLPDDKAAENAAVTGEVSTPRRPSNHSIGDSPKPAKVPISSCYYLVQVYELPDKPPAGADGAAGTQSSELDDTDRSSTTFSLTQHDATSQGATLFDLAKAYDQEDDLLRGLVLEEYKSQLSCDVVISPALRAKDPPKQGSRQATGSGKVPLAALSSLNNLSGSPKHHGGQVLEEEQDEGDNEPSESGPAGAGNQVSAGAAKRRWDPNVLSNVCRWRSCMCDSVVLRVGKTGSFKQKQLCSYHLDMKEYLDSRGGKQSTLESSKYLPRKAPNFNTSAMQEKKRDMMTIRAASTLLQELWDGKLRATVRSFAKKVVRDMTPRVFLDASNTTFLIAHPHYMLYLSGSVENSGGSRNTVNPFSMRSYLASRPAIEHVANSVVPAQPTWAIWKNKLYFERYVWCARMLLCI